MRYGITFTARARRQISALLDGPRDSERVNDAIMQIDAELRHDADIVGEGRGGDRRVQVLPPLTVFFRVDRATERATVTRVVRHEPPPLKPREFE